MLNSGRNTFNNNADSGVVPVGISRSQLSDLMKTFSDGPNKNLYFADRRLIGSDGRANPQYLLPPTTPGAMGAPRRHGGHGDCPERRSSCCRAWPAARSAATDTP
jgi:hypothetical protein